MVIKLRCLLLMGEYHPIVEKSLSCVDSSITITITYVPRTPEFITTTRGFHACSHSAQILLRFCSDSSLNLFWFFSESVLILFWFLSDSAACPFISLVFSALILALRRRDHCSWLLDATIIAWHLKLVTTRKRTSATKRKKIRSCWDRGGRGGGDDRK